MININGISISPHIAVETVKKIIEREHRKSLAYGNESRLHLERITEGFRGVGKEELNDSKSIL